ncbi:MULTISPECIES: TetR/AcrR family transcriptional regulator [Heyndrickxia]|uniref:TetR/AcrR family transcriptional regulator n=1 Tax=Heyndrickxia vini TaxID=1476025 RepID=A0ABX7DZQ8_9BACI|nr:MULTISPECIES: TetR/AcrR family transcriptional regulator [Heyndrickxia]MED3656087.1 TetR/AcrR family transcriptional regulator [Heyndrickxia sporothermodurans]QQZ08964.1 TetR/AcrR family transcriptional regulator [Heyndrickxia vini]
MNDRKQNVIKMAHQLFIDKGFQATSIQEILDYSGISKGTFYNYFSSKSELLMAIFKTNHTKLEKDRNSLLIGQSPSDIEIFIKQLEMQMKANQRNKLFTLFEEVMVSNDNELKAFLKQGQLRVLSWIYQRLIDIFGESKKPYLLDSAIMFTGILQQNIKYHFMAKDTSYNINHVIRYSVERLIGMVNELEKSGNQLFNPEQLEGWLPNCIKDNRGFQQKLYRSILDIKKGISNDQTNQIRILDFVEEELFDSKKPRKFLIESVLFSLKSEPTFINKKALQRLEQLIEDYFAYLDTETSSMEA